MSRIVEVPVTPSVLRWALDQSGYSRDDVSGRLGVSGANLRAWEKGDSRPTLTEFRRLADLLHRQTAVFFLPSPPEQTTIRASLRSAPGEARTSLNVVERLYLREASRIQRALAWALQEMRSPRVQIGSETTSAKPEQAAARFRERIGVTVAQQTFWKDESEAFRIWRTALEGLGICVFVFPMKRDSVSGFATWNDHAPVISVNSAWNIAARIFTLFHEVGHLLTRTDSACLGHVDSVSTSRDLVLERWCERFSASFLLPRNEVRLFLETKLRWRKGLVCNLEHAGKVAKHFKISLRASVVALTELGIAEENLYATVSAATDKKMPGGRGRPRTRDEIKGAQLGSRTHATLIRAMREELITRADVLSYLDVRYDDLAAGETGA